MRRERGGTPARDRLRAWPFVRRHGFCCLIAARRAGEPLPMAESIGTGGAVNRQIVFRLSRVFNLSGLRHCRRPPGAPRNAALTTMPKPRRYAAIDMPI